MLVPQGDSRARRQPNAARMQVACRARETTSVRNYGFRALAGAEPLKQDLLAALPGAPVQAGDDAANGDPAELSGLRGTGTQQHGLVKNTLPMERPAGVRTTRVDTR